MLIRCKRMIIRTTAIEVPVPLAATVMIVRTEAVVLRKLDYGETSQIVTLFTREKGKIAVMAKGARRTKSTFGSSLQPTAYTQVVFYYKPTRGLQTLSESALAAPLLAIPRDLERLTIGLRMVELTEALMQDEDPQPRVFNLLVEVLRRLNGSSERLSNLLPYYQLRLALLLGFAPTVRRDDVERLTERGGLLALSSGAVHPVLREAEDTHRRASRSALRAYAVLARADLDTVMRMRMTPGVRRETHALVEDFLRYHVQDAYPSRSRDVISQLRPGEDA